MTLYRRKTYEVVGYTYEADYHCLTCAEKRFGQSVYNLDFEAEDHEGNPVHPIFLGSLEGDEHCGDCLEAIT